MFSAVLGFGSSAIGAIGSSMAASAAAEAQMYQAQLADQANRRAAALAAQQQGMAQDAFSMERIWADLVRGNNDRNQFFSTNQRDYGRNLIADDRALADFERQFDVTRQQSMDRAEASERARRLEAMLENQRLTYQERQRALAEYDYVKRIASGERSYDISQFNRALAQSEEERQWQIEEYRRRMAQAQAEREYDIGQRELMRQSTDRFSQALQAAYAELGPMADTKLLGQPDIEAEVARRTADYQSDVDRAAEAVASVSEAGLIRSGMDTSTPAIQRRGEIAERLSNEYQQARNKAATDAIAYISGINSELVRQPELDRLRRAAIMGEVGSVYGSPLDFQLRLPEVRGAAQFADFNTVGSGVYDRQLVSGNNFQAPMAIGSGVYDRLAESLGSGYSNFDVARTSRAGPYDYDGIYQLQLPNLSSAAGFAGSAGGIMGGVADNYRRTASEYGGYAQDAAGAAGSAWQDLFRQGGSMLDDWWRQRRSRPDPHWETDYDKG